ncbi:MAG: hypothetical protein JWN96_3143 [Mycobacterium sp.]|jgi:hypothetical protein|nr:hypothetical protein [Mycobacterium sp.]
MIAARIEDQKRRTQAAMKDADLRPGDSPDVIQGKLRAAAAAHDVATGSDFSRLSRFFAAGLGKRGTRTVRLLVESGRGLRAARRLGPPLARESENGREIHGMRRALAAIWAAAAAAFVAARIASGGPRVAIATVAGFLAALGTVFAALTYTVNSVTRAAGQPPRLTAAGGDATTGSEFG